jgi:hypothetical protein
MRKRNKNRGNKAARTRKALRGQTSCLVASVLGAEPWWHWMKARADAPPSTASTDRSTSKGTRSSWHQGVRLRNLVAVPNTAAQTVRYALEEART